MRGIFTAGVLDWLLDEKILFSSVYGVSAGACHACSYLSGQRGRAYRVGVDYLEDKRYCSFESMLKTGDLFGAQMCYDIIPNQLNPYDYEAFSRYEGAFFAVVTNCATGQAEYHRITDMHRDVISVRASSSLPLLSRNVRIGDQEYLDGGAADSIPVRRSVEDGNQKNVVVLTQAADYRKTPNKMMPLIRVKYRRYPRFIETMETRYLKYNETLEYIRREEEAGRLLVIRPRTTPEIGRIEKNRDKLQALYEQGYEEAKRNGEKLEAFLGTPDKTVSKTDPSGKFAGLRP